MNHTKQAAQAVVDTWADVRIQLDQAPPVDKGGEPVDYAAWERWHHGPYRKAWDKYVSACKAFIDATGQHALHHTAPKVNLVSLARGVLGAQSPRHHPAHVPNPRSS